MQYKVGRVASVSLGRESFRPGCPVPKRCQEIEQIKIHGADYPFFTVFWREKHKKYEIKRD